MAPARAKIKRTRSSAKSSGVKMRQKIVSTIRSIPRGKVSTYGAVAAAAGYPGYARQVAWVLGRSEGLPWHRILGAGGEIKVPLDYVMEQRMRLQSENVSFRGRRVNMAEHEFKFGRVGKKRKTP